MASRASVDAAQRNRYRARPAGISVLYAHLVEDARRRVFQRAMVMSAPRSLRRSASRPSGKQAGAVDVIGRLAEILEPIGGDLQTADRHVKSRAPGPRKCWRIVPFEFDRSMQYPDRAWAMSLQPDARDSGIFEMRAPPSSMAQVSGRLPSSWSRRPISKQIKPQSAATRKKLAPKATRVVS